MTSKEEYKHELLNELFLFKEELDYLAAIDVGPFSSRYQLAQKQIQKITAELKKLGISNV
jgi:hypothetical protein